jgi:hypothetical protein
MAIHHELSAFIWQIADFPRGPYRPPQYECVMLPMTVQPRFAIVFNGSPMFTASAKLEGLRAAAERTVVLLKVRCAALIATAVTGKIAVPTCPASGENYSSHEN